MKQILLSACLCMCVAPAFACQITEISESACTPANPSPWNLIEKKQQILSHKQVTLKNSCTENIWTETRICDEQFNVDTTPPTCTTKFSELDTNGDTYWVNHPIIASLDTCHDATSGCNTSSALETLTPNHNQVGTVTIQDHAGNTQTCQPTSALSKIDTNPPQITRLQITSTQSSIKNPLLTWEREVSHEIRLSAAEKYHIHIEASDANVSSESGQSGIDWDQAELLITDAEESIKVHDKFLHLIGPDFNIIDAPGGKEVILDTQVNGSQYAFLAKSGFYRMAIILEDKAHNRTATLGHYLQIVPGNPDSYTFDATAKTSDGTGYQNGSCDNLVADAVGGCQFSISVSDSFGNVLGHTGTARTDSGITPTCTVNYVQKSTAPPLIQNVFQWEKTPYGYDETQSLFLTWDCDASPALIPVSGAHISCDHYPSIPPLVDESGEYPLFWNHLTSENTLTCEVAPFTDEKIFTNHKTIKQLRLPQSCRYNFFNGYLCLDAWLPF